MYEGNYRCRMATLLLIEDEPVFASTVSRYLANEGFDVTVAETGAEGLERFESLKPDVVLLDLRLPDVDGFEICRELRSRSTAPLIILSAREDGTDKVLGLELGADDYATKSMPHRELLARIRAVTRRAATSHEDPSVIDLGRYRVDRTAHEVTGPDGVIDLTQREFELTWYLASHAGEALERERLFNDVWHQQGLGSSRTIDSHVVSLRKKLSGVRISSIRGFGYRLEPDG